MQFDPNAAGAVIRRLRTQRRFSQDVLSGLAGIARSHLSMIETGAKQPNFETIWCIAQTLDRKPSHLVSLIEAEADSERHPRTDEGAFIEREGGPLHPYTSPAALSSSVLQGFFYSLRHPRPRVPLFYSRFTDLSTAKPSG